MDSLLKFFLYYCIRSCRAYGNIALNGLQIFVHIFKIITCCAGFRHLAQHVLNDIENLTKVYYNRYEKNTTLGNCILSMFILIY